MATVRPMLVMQAMIVRQLISRLMHLLPMAAVKTKVQ